MITKKIKTIRYILFAILTVASSSCMAQTNSKDTTLTFTVRKPSEISEIYTIAEQMPVFPGGDDALYNFLGINLRYPQDAKKAGLQGIVYITFVVDTIGNLTSGRILRSSGNISIDQEALRVMNLMPLWIPGRHRGKAVSVQINLPVNFQLK